MGVDIINFSHLQPQDSPLEVERALQRTANLAGEDT